MFMTAGIGKNFDNEEGTFAWSISNDKLDIGTSNGDNINFALKSVTDNKYTFTITDPSKTSESDFFRAKPLSISNLNGKIIAYDVSNDADCTARTLKVTGNSGNIKEVCTGGNSDIPVTLSSDTDVDNLIHINININNEILNAAMTLIEGDMSQGGTFGLIHSRNSIFTKVEISPFTLTTQEAF